MRICRAFPADAPAIVDLQRLCYQSQAELYGEFDLPPLLETVDDLRGAFDSMVVLKADDGGRLIGSVRAHESEGTCRIARLMVHPDRQDQGIGTRLMEAIEACFPSARRFELFTGDRSEKNLGLYAKLGYREIKRQRQTERVMLVYLRKVAQ